MSEFMRRKREPGDDFALRPFSDQQAVDALLDENHQEEAYTGGDLMNDEARYDTMLMRASQTMSGGGKVLPMDAEISGPMQMIMDRFMSGMNPETILDQMAGPQARQAKQIIHGKSTAQLRSIAMNMAQQRGVNLGELAQQLGVRLPE